MIIKDTYLLSEMLGMKNVQITCISDLDFAIFFFDVLCLSVCMYKCTNNWVILRNPEESTGSLELELLPVASSYVCAGS